MNGLKISELTEGKIYICRLSGLKLLVKKIPLKVIETMTGSQVAEWKLSCMYFNPQTGSYQQVDPADYQLIEASKQL